jgi:Amt family ammonium transporter
VAFACVFSVSYGVLLLIKKTIGLRVTPEEEEAGLDISEHGMYGYPEQFIPRPEYSTGIEFGPAPLPSNSAPAVSQMTTSTKTEGV